MTKSPLISIIVPVFNAEATIERALNSLIDNSYDIEMNLAKKICTILIQEGLSDKTDRRRPEKKYAKNIKMIILYMSEHYKELDLTIEKLANLCGYSIAYFTKAFKAYMNDSPIIHLTKLRISEAKTLMLENDKLKFGEISTMVGYKNISTFTEGFKRITGLTPKEFKSKYIIKKMPSF